jgi:hypothetical protein
MVSSGKALPGGRSFRLGEKNQKPPGGLYVCKRRQAPAPRSHRGVAVRTPSYPPTPHNSALSSRQLKQPGLCASLELQAAASATGGAAFRSSRGRAGTQWSSCLVLGSLRAAVARALCASLLLLLHFLRLGCVAAHPPCAVTPAEKSYATVAPNGSRAKRPWRRDPGKGKTHFHF